MIGDELYGVQKTVLAIAAIGCTQFAAAKSGRCLILQRMAAGVDHPTCPDACPKIGYKAERFELSPFGLATAVSWQIWSRLRGFGPLGCSSPSAS